MEKSEEPGCGRFDLEITRYAYGELPVDKRAAVEAHVNGCTRCSEFVLFTQKFNVLARKGLTNINSASEPCPEASLIVDLEADALDERAAQHVRAHLLHCKGCREEYLLLRKLSDQKIEERAFADLDAAQSSRSQLFAKLATFVIDLGKTYAPGALIGSIRIAAEQPALAVRGGGLPKAVSKTLEVSVGENTYSIELAVTEQGSISCDIAGVRTPVKVPLRISVHSGEEDELISDESDEFGNSRFVVPSTQPPHELLLLTLKLPDNEQQILLRVIDGGKAT